MRWAVLVSAMVWTMCADAAEITPGSSGVVKRETWGCTWDAWKSLGTFDNREHFHRYILIAEQEKRCTRLRPGTKLTVMEVSVWNGATRVQDTTSFATWWVTSSVLADNAAPD